MYLDPRPNRASINLAYKTYYTHPKTGAVSRPAPSRLAKLKLILANGYKNWRFGTKLRPASPLGVVAAFLVPPARARMQKEYRNLPRLHRPGRVLDVGFGDGSFLRNAEQIGWEAIGIDTDPEVVKSAHASCLNVHLTSLEEFLQPDCSFDVITMNHVIEHVHDPQTVLNTCHRLLRPGGTLWLETPNSDSLGHQFFKKNWRGLEAPRHLVVFNRKSLQSLLCSAGFRQVRDVPQASPCSSVFTASDRMRKGLTAQAPYEPSLSLRAMAVCARVLESLAPSQKEFIAVEATKN